MQIHRTPHDLTTDLDISSTAFWNQPFDERDAVFAKLRADAPVSWHRSLEDPSLPEAEHGETGFWAIVTHAEISYASQHHELFSSELGSTMLRPRRESDPLERSFIHLDPPIHTAFRKVMSAGFTPKAVAKLAAKIDERAASIVGRVRGGGEFDFVSEVSAKLPMMTVADLVGVPEHHIEAFAHAGDEIVSLQDQSSLPEGVDLREYAMQQIGIIGGIAMELAAARRADPQDDIMTALVNCELDGKKLSDRQLIETMVLLSVAGNDTTKQSTSRTLFQLSRNPQQRAWLEEDFDARIVSSVEEFVRHASPVIQMARTATRDLEFGGQQIAAGDKIGLFYCSSNRDETIFERAHEFDLQRSRAVHHGFGGGGVHFCLGNGVAKAQLKALFREILTQLPTIEVGEPEYLTGNFINGVRHLPVVVR